MKDIFSARRRSEQNTYDQYVNKNRLILTAMTVLTIFMAIFAIHAGSTDLNMHQVVMTLLGQGNSASDVVIWNLRLPRVLAAMIAGAGLSVAGCVMQNNLRNPLASPSTMGISNAAAFGANVAIIVLGAGSMQSNTADAVIIHHPYMVTLCAFFCSMLATVGILFLARIRNFSSESMVLAGVALGSLFTAGTILIQYFAQDVEVASVVFWTFGDVGGASWAEVKIMAVVMLGSILYFMARRWDYNAINSGEETAQGLGVHVRRVRLTGMFVACMMTAVSVSFLGIIGFVGLVAPQMMRRIVGSDHRYLIPGSVVMGALLLLVSDTIARTVISPIVLPVGAITSFMGAPLFLYILARGNARS